MTAVYSSVCLYGQVLKREHGRVLKRALDFEVEGQRKKSRPKRTWKKQVEEEYIKVDLTREDTLCLSKWSVSLNHNAAGLQ